MLCLLRIDRKSCTAERQAEVIETSPSLTYNAKYIASVAHLHRIGSTVDDRANKAVIYKIVVKQSGAHGRVEEAVGNDGNEFGAERGA